MRVKITPRKKRPHAAGREKNEELQTKPKLACVASVSARVRRESWEESKKRNDGGGGGERRKRLPANPTILKNCVRPRTQLLIGAVLVVLIT